MVLGIRFLTFFLAIGQFGFPVASQFEVAIQDSIFCVGGFKMLCCRVEDSSPEPKMKLKRDGPTKKPSKKVVCYGGKPSSVDTRGLKALAYIHIVYRRRRPSWWEAVHKWTPWILLSKRHRPCRLPIAPL